MSTLVGMQLSGRYRLDAQIGAGGMSTVYKAFDVNLERRVAIKLLHREMSADSDQLERFRREARAVAQLSHPHIVGVIDAGEDENRPYIVFEYVEGETLKDRIRRLGRLPVDEALAYAIEIARALGCAHAHEIVHRDVKPQNVLLDPEGSAKVTDFGIARSLRDDGLTADGRVLGTTDYVSPEQALGHDVDGQSDIYSLGIVLYEMLTGRRPVPRREPDLGRDEARPRGPSGHPAHPPRGLRHHRRGAGPHDRQGPRAPLRRRPVADRRPRGRARAGGRPPGHLHRRGHRGHPHPPRPRAPPAAVPDAPLAAGARDHRPDRRRGGDRPIIVSREVPPRVERGTGPGRIEQSTPDGHQGRLRPARLGPRLRPARRQRGAQRGGVARRRPRRRHLWSTESYQDGLEGAGKSGVGIYIDAKPKVAAVQMQIDTPKPGFKATIYAAPPGAVPKSVPEGWTKVGGGTVSSSNKRFKLDTGGTEYRYYLVWITKLAPDSDQRRDLRDPPLPGSRGVRGQTVRLRTRRRVRSRSVRAPARAGGRTAPGRRGPSPPRASGRRWSR